MCGHPNLGFLTAELPGGSNPSCRAHYGERRVGRRLTDLNRIPFAYLHRKQKTTFRLHPSTKN
jgi:hypothetical protein